MRGDDGAGGTVEQIVEAGLGLILIPDRLVEYLGVIDPPAGVGVDLDHYLAARGHLLGVAVPLKVSFLKGVNLIDERDAKIKASFAFTLGLGVDRIADDFAKTGHEHLLGFVDDVNRGRNQNDKDEGSKPDDDG